MGVKISRFLSTTLQYSIREFEDAFDCVLCDAPCFGVLSSKPDIKLFRKESDVEGACGIAEQNSRRCGKVCQKGRFFGLLYLHGVQKGKRRRGQRFFA